ncbi:tRNA pseudouridine synthase A [Comamonas testosteroni]|uniref:tRNA pseudouridine synthase A n=1 Tax=Comamonas testosteroni TaxID=285 RepID=A0A1Y1J9J7_COMTE|nr:MULTISPECIES: tRNA pseudouridine(38-40) synthase TruA [Comamonas]BDR07682.1 tRNA pseudouridine(38-40) synthase TruA [Comamonas thiooxydans]GEQ74052.1 tRNA pseudouridine synthase A [Comamonas testosteroni]
MRIALGVSYNGQAYRGWQSQPDGNTVQDKLEAALGRFAAQEVSTICAGRTDSGVHGLMQVVHFDTELQRAPNSWVRGTNTFLPKDIAVQWAAEVADGPDGFHSRACATARRYAYVLLQSPVRPSVDQGRVGWVFQALDAQRMRAAADLLLGEHDFSSFRAAGCQAKSPVKTLRRIDIHYRPAGQAPMRDAQMECGYWRFEFEGSAFLHHMIRNIMGCLIYVGQGSKPVEWMQQVLEARSREVAAPTFSPDGLYFLGPIYDTRWGLPADTPPFAWLP